MEGAEEGIWEVRCVLLLWLAILVLVPFDLATIDSRCCMQWQLLPATSYAKVQIYHLKHSYRCMCDRLLSHHHSVRPNAQQSGGILHILYSWTVQRKEYELKPCAVAAPSAGLLSQRQLWCSG